MSKSLETRVTPIGPHIKQLRQSLKISQQRLAKATGLTRRTIIKMESGKTVNFSTVKSVADWLNKHGGNCTVEDLCSDPLMLAKSFVNIYKTYEIDFMKHAKHIIHPEVVIDIAGDPEVIPFAGQYHGHDGMDKFWKNFFTFVVRPDKDFFQPEYLVEGSRVVASGKELAKIRGHEHIEDKPSWIILEFEMKDGLIIHFVDRYDTQSAHQGTEDFLNDKNIN